MLLFQSFIGLRMEFKLLLLARLCNSPYYHVNKV
nr:MAG TPA: hypothetical protein [Caudoviricetes sp.]